LKLPDIIQIRPLTVPARGTVSVPGSKSLTNRGLILAALGEGWTELRGALWAEDTEHMAKALQALGFELEVKPDPTHECNRLLRVRGQKGRIPAREAELYVGTAGTTARFLAAFCALGKGSYRIHGSPRMHERPMRELFDALRSVGAQVEDQDGRLPATISGPVRPGRVFIAGEDSSQFASAMLLISRAAEIVVDSPPSPYVDMTQRLLGEWKDPAEARDVEPDASSGSYFIALRHLHGGNDQAPALQIDRWPVISSQVDHHIADFLPPPPQVSREKDLGDAVLTLAVSAAALRQAFRLVEAAHLRKQECDRIAVMASELAKCGVPAREEAEELILEPARQFKSAVIRTHNDHRIAMSFAVLGSVDAMGDGSPWITLENPSCVSKSFPNFFETLESVARQSYERAGRGYEPMILGGDAKPVFA